VTESLIERGRERKSDINERRQAGKTKMEREGVIGIK
jgi:ribose 1,5-bisphosphokinase PhnN